MRAAQDLFYRQGIRATGIDRIIAEAGVTKVTFYRHFPSKDGLIRAYLERRHAAWMGWFQKALSSSRAAQSEAERGRLPWGPCSTQRELGSTLPSSGAAPSANTVAEAGGGRLADHQHRRTAQARGAGCHRGATAAGCAGNTDIAWAATLALDGAAVNAQLGRASVDMALDGLRILLDALGSQPSLP